MIAKVFDLIHGLILFIPIIIFLIPKIKNHHFLLLFISLVPLHWVFFENQCFLTIVSRKHGGMKETETTSGFSETYLRWLYEPIMKLFGWKWESKGLDKIVTLHWIINIIIVWYYSFYYK